MTKRSSLSAVAVEPGPVEIVDTCRDGAGDDTGQPTIASFASRTPARLVVSGVQ